MFRRSLVSKLSLRSWLKRIGVPKARKDSGRRPAKHYQLSFEFLEDRLAPATLTQAGTTLTIDLDNANEALQIVSNGATYGLVSTHNFVNGGLTTAAFSGFGSTSGALTPTGLTQIDVIDSQTGASVTFNNSGGNTYAQLFSVDLDNSPTGDITFNGASTFNLGLSATTSDGDIQSAAGSSLILGGGQNLSLSAGNGTIELLGSVLVPGTATLGAECGIRADNAANDFQGNVNITQTGFDRLTIIRDANAFSLGVVSVDGDLTVNAGGSITQTGAITFTSTQTLTLATTSGNISLNNGGNDFNASILNLRTDAVAGNITVVDLSGNDLTPGDITLGLNGTGTGTLSLTTQGDIFQPVLDPAGPGPQNGIRTGGAVAITIDTAVNRDVILARLPNSIAGVVTISESNGGDVRDLSLRNVNTDALLPDISALAASDIRNYTLVFDNDGIDMTALTVTGNIVLTGGGQLTQTGALVGVNGTFTALGNFGINLTNAANAFSGSISLNNPDADATTSVAYVESGASLSLANGDLGLGTLSVSGAGSVTQAGGSRLTQRPGAGAVTFAAGGTGITIGNAGNLFTGPVTFVGAAVTAITFRNDDPLASAFPTLPAGFNDDLTIAFGAAPIVLPALTGLASLSVSAQGIFQSGALDINGLADFRTDNRGDGFSIQLTDAANDFTDIRLRTDGPAAVAVADLNALNFSGGDSIVGFGTLTITAGGSITQAAGQDIIQTGGGSPAAGLVSITATAGAINLGNAGNDFVGPVVVSTAGVNLVTIRDANMLMLGTINLGGNFTAQGAAITQVPGTTLTVGGNSTFTGILDLDNLGNTFTGSVSINGAGGSLRDSNALDLAASNATSLLVTAGGPITDSGSLVVGSARFDAGANAITLNNANDFINSVSLISTGSANVLVVDVDSISLDQVLLGSGTLTITAGFLIDQTATGFIRQTGTGLLTFDAGVGNNVDLDSTSNTMLGLIAFNAGGAGDVTLFNNDDINFAPGTDFAGDIEFNAQGVVTLPTTALNVFSLSSTARETVVANNITTAGNPGDITIVGGLRFTNAAGTAIDTSLALNGEVQIQGDVVTAGALTFSLGAAGRLAFGFDPALEDHGRGIVWNQGTFNLTINNGELILGDGAHKAVFQIGGAAVINMTAGDGDVTVNENAIFQVGVNPAAAEIVTLNNGTGDLDFEAGSTLLVGLGAVNDKLVKLGSGDVTIATDITNTNPATRLLGNGVTGLTPTNVLEVGGGEIVGLFDNTVNTKNVVVDFLMGTDIVTPTYTCDTLAAQRGGTAAPGGSFSIFQSDGDRVTVTTAAAAGLAFVEDEIGRLAIVARTANAATTLTVAATKLSGDGLAQLGGIGVNGAGAVTISAATANVTGDILVSGRLASLNIRDVANGAIRAGGTTAGTTAITGRVFTDVDIDLVTVLSALAVKEYVEGSSPPENIVVAERFGTITAAGLAVADILGDFHTNLASRTASTTTPTLTSATIAGDLSGDWDLRNTVGAVTARTTTDWSLGLPDGPLVRNGALLSGSTGVLNLGVVADSNIHVIGRIASIMAKSWNGVNGPDDRITAGSVGSITTTGDLPNGDVGDFEFVDLLLTGNSTGTALGTLNVAGELNNVDLEARNGNVTSISVGRSILSSNLRLETSATSGQIGTLKAGLWNGGTLDAKSVQSFSLVGNAVDQIFGDLANVQAILHGTAGSTAAALGTFSAAGNVSNSNFLVENGGVTSFTVGRQLSATPISILGGAGGTLGAINVGRWVNSDLTAKSIGTLKVNGALQTAPASPALNGDMLDSSIDTFLTGTGKSIGTFLVTGDLDFDTGAPPSADFLRADNGITSFTVKRQMSDGFLLVNNSSPAAVSVGRIDALSVGSWINVDLAVNSLGTAIVTSFTRIENGTNNFVAGDFEASTVTVRGGTLAAPIVGVTSFTVNGDFDQSTLSAPVGIATLTVNRRLINSTITTVNPLSTTLGRINSLTVKHMGDSSAGPLITTHVRANTLGSFKTLKGAVADVIALGLDGDVVRSEITATGFTGTAAAPVGIGTLSIASDLDRSTLNARHRVGNFTVLQDVTFSTVGAGLAVNGQIAVSNVGRWLDSDLVANNLGTFNVNGNTNFAAAGDVRNSLFALTGSIGGVALGAFKALGTVGDSLFHVTAGNVSSFTSGRFLGSDLLVGVHLAHASQLNHATPPTWLGNFLIGSFKTTQVFSAADVEDTASFRDSNVVAQRLGTLSLTGIDDLAIAASPVTFGFGFRIAGGAAGALTINGVPRAAGFTQGRFIYTGLAG